MSLLLKVQGLNQVYVATVNEDLYTYDRNQDRYERLQFEACGDGAENDEAMQWKRKYEEMLSKSIDLASKLKATQDKLYRAYNAITRD